MARNGLTVRQRRGIAALMQSRTVADAARTAGVGRRTLDRWLTDPDFVAELNAATGAAVDQAVRRLADLSGQAVDTLADVMAGATETPSARVSAANVTLTHMARLRELGEIEARIAELEKALKGGTDNGQVGF